MKRGRSVCSVFGIVLALLVASPVAGQNIPQLADSLTPEWARSFNGIRVYTEPVDDSLMGFGFSADLAEVGVKAGDRVKKGDLLVRARDGEARAAVALAKFQAETNLEIDLAKNAHQLATLEFKKIEEVWLANAGSTEIEYETKKAELEAARLQVENANYRKRERELQLAVRQADLDKYSLNAPFDGIIESVRYDVGQIVRDTDPVLRVVRVDRLRIYCPTPEKVAIPLRLKPGDPVYILIDNPEKPMVYKGEVAEVSPRVDFAAKALPVWVEFENVDALESGLTAWVRFSPPEGEWAEKLARQQSAGESKAISIASKASAGDGRD